MDENHFNCIYMFTNKINGKRYVGQTKNFYKRYNSHIYSSYDKNSNRHNVPFHKAIRKYGIDNFQIDILIDNIQTKEEMNELEKSLICFFNTLCKNNMGYNVAEGGESGNPFAGKTDDEMAKFRDECRERNLGKKLSEETKKKISEKNKKMFFSEEHRRKINESKKGKKRQGEWIEKMAEKKRGSKHSEETRKKMSDSSSKKRKIIQLNKDNEIIQVWNSIKEASVFLGLDSSAIIKCCKGKLKKVGGFKWKYYEEAEVNNDGRL